MLNFDWNISGITSDSRLVRPGYLFAALPGQNFDGRNFMAQAVANGARVILAPEGTQCPEGEVKFITDLQPRRRFAMLCAEYYGSQPDYIAAVTATNGKTSTVNFTHQIWQALGMSSASLGTLGIHSHAYSVEDYMTTPDPSRLHAYLADMAAAGISHLAMEASSHGLDQSRLDGVEVRAAAFINLTHDHLDYHGTMESYFHAKARLFTDILAAQGTAILNADSAYYPQLKEICGQRGVKMMDFGYAAEQMTVLAADPDPGGLRLQLNYEDQEYALILPLVGRFQVQNVLAAAGLVLAEGNHRAEQVIGCLRDLKGAPGRLQYVIGHPREAAIYVDYAHTPDSLKKVLTSLRHHTQNKLICLFGCGGDRDTKKRPLMGQIASQYADVAILTDDNPRNENAASIRREVMQGNDQILEIGDRRQAIRHCLELAETGDLVVITGKGHEQGQKIGSTIHPFDDVTEAKKALEDLA